MAECADWTHKSYGEALAKLDTLLHAKVDRYGKAAIEVNAQEQYDRLGVALAVLRETERRVNRHFDEGCAALESVG
jgi:hypothetical protein